MVLIQKFHLKLRNFHELYFSGGNLVSEGQMTIGALTSFILYAGYTAISLGGLSNFYTELNKGNWKINVMA